MEFMTEKKKTQFKKAEWIWAENNNMPNDWVIFIKKFDVKILPEIASLNIYCDTKYFLWLNGEMTVFDGGLFRESTPGNGWYDTVSLGKRLKTGENVLAIKVWYYGNGGRNNTSSDAAGLIFESSELNLYSDKNTLCLRDPAHISTGEPHPSYLYGGHNIGYDANKDIGEFYRTDFNAAAFKPSTVYGKYSCSPWNAAEPRCIPFFKFGGIIKPHYNKDENTYTAKLPYAMQYTPYFKAEAQGGEIIDIRSDRYYVNGGPGDESNSYRGHRTEYKCKKGVQAFESLNWIFGEEIIFTIPEGIKIFELGYRESGYDAEILFNNFKTNDEKLNKLLNKCARTLIVCMRDNFMDCPDRERGQWIGDVSVQAPQIFYALDKSAMPLLRKACLDFIRLRKDSVLVGNVPGDHFSELPAQSLNAISETGMLAVFYKNTGDKEILRLGFNPCVEYLKLWDTDEDGLPKPRNGDWRWFDHLYNIDEAVLESAWYYSALKFAAFTAEELGDKTHDDFLQGRIKGIETAFDKAYWKGGYYSSGSFADDRANAMAVLSGLAGKEKYPQLHKILLTVFNSTTYMENYVLEALCQMGYKNDAYNRMTARYAVLTENENSTLWEDFFILGTRNHAWSGAPLTIICKYFPELIIKHKW